MIRTVRPADPRLGVPLAQRLADLDRYARRCPVTATELDDLGVRSRLVGGTARRFTDAGTVYLEAND